MAYLKKIVINWDRVDDRNVYPYNVPAISRLERQKSMIHTEENL